MTGPVILVVGARPNFMKILHFMQSWQGEV